MPATPTPSAPPGNVLPGGNLLDLLRRFRPLLADLEHAGIILGALLVVLLVLAPVMRRTRPGLYWRCFGVWFLRWRMRRTWGHLTTVCDLTTSHRPKTALVGDVTVKGRPLQQFTPRLVRLRYRPAGLSATVMLLSGQTPDQYADAADAMAHAWKVHAVRVTSPTRGRVTLTITARDPLTDPNRPANGGLDLATISQETNMDVATDAVASRRRTPTDPRARSNATLAVPVGDLEDGRAWVLDLGVIPHWLIVGATRSGKSTLLNAAVVQLSMRRVALVGIDCKGGMELAAYAPRLSALATDRKEAAEVLSKALAIAHERMTLCRNARVRNIWQLSEDARPVPIVVIVDELAELYLAGNRQEKEHAAQASTALLRLAQLGAALGIHLIIAGQRVGSELGGAVTALRAQLGGRVCHHVHDPETATMTLGDLHPDAVEAAQSISPFEPGVAITTDPDAGWLRARSHLMTPEDAQLAAETFAPLAPDLPGLDRPMVTAT
jgi:S-DNA-T family DNA segregation ATPase FtsK/SpoIIIE